jgi:hypothetical protein
MLAVEGMLVRRRLAGRVRKVARVEREELHRAPVVEFGPMRVRRELYEALVARIGDRARPLPPDGVRALEAFLSEDPPARDYGSTALARNARIAACIEELDGGRS